MKTSWVKLLVFLSLFVSCMHKDKVQGIYRTFSEKRGNYDVWIVDGSLIRQKIYKEFLYGGNEQRYCYVPVGEMWIDNAISCEEYELTLAHELNERHLMAKFGWTYDKSHDSSLRVELVMRHRFDSICRDHESKLKVVSPTDWSNVKEIPTIADSIRLNGIYRIPVGIREGLSIWVVDGYLVRKTIFPDFGFSGNDLVYNFIPKGEIWIDGQVSCEEMEYSILSEISERSLMISGKSYSDAYEASVEKVRVLRDKMEEKVRNRKEYLIPDTLARDSGVIDPSEQ